MAVLGKSIGALPLSEEVIVVGSTESKVCMVNLYTKSGYLGLEKTT